MMQSSKPLYLSTQKELKKTGGELKSTTEIDIATPDTFYYSLVIKNTATTYQNATFIEDRQLPLVDKANEWNLFVVSFTVPGEDIPIIQTFSNSRFSVTMTYGGSTVQTFLVYGFADNTLGNTDVFSYGQFLLILNTALTTCYNALKVLQPGIPNASAPYMIYNSSSFLMTLVAPTSYDIYANLPSPPNSALLYFNNNLTQFFQSLLYIYNTVPAANGEDSQVVITNLRNNTSGGNYLMVEEFSCLENWNDFLSLVFISNLMPVNKESIPSSSGSGLTNANSIFIEFTPSIALGPEARGTLQYNANLYQIINMTTDQPLRTVDMQVFWKDRNQTLNPLRLAPGGSVQIKLGFRKKILAV
jgi:hypothetical protein